MDDAYLDPRIGFAIVVVLAAIIMVFSVIVPFVTQDSVTLTVIKTDSYTTTECTHDSDGGGCSTTLHNLVYTNDEVLQFNDCLVLWVWGSQTMYSHIEPKKTYTFKVYGLRFAPLNWYRSVISYTEV